jgi:mono/diheme cytochrome c family protein
VTVRHVLIALNLVAVLAIIVYLVWAVLSPKRASEEITPANLTPFLADDDLESRRLERVQGWALLFAAIVAVALPLYWLHEPSRQKESISYFSKNAAHRGEILFSNSAMGTYDPTQSLQCANCHGVTGGGGQVSTFVNGQSVLWQAPPLNTVLERFEEDPDCAMPVDDQPDGTICDVTDIITYGRPGTPMQGWGVAGGGPKNVQSIQDLVAYLRTIQLTPAQIQAEEAATVTAARSTDPNTICPQYVSCPVVQEDAARTALKTDTDAFNADRTALQTALKQPDATDAQLTSSCNAIIALVKTDPKQVVPAQATACGTYSTAATLVTSDKNALAWTISWVTRRANVSDGQILFEANCARCHTQGWSTFDSAVPPDQPGGVDQVGPPGGGGGVGGGIGPNLRNNDEIRRFGDDPSGGFAAQVAFVSAGSMPFKAYGISGIGSGRMPGFASMLTKDQIAEIVSYERYCLDTSTFLGPEPVCATLTTPRVPATTTTTVKAAG